MSSALALRVAALRRFNRLYTQRIGALDERHLDSEFSLVEVRVLYEVARARGISAAEIVGTLGLDAGYVSRIVHRFVRRGLLTRGRARHDARVRPLVLTAAGRRAFAALDRRAAADVEALLAGLGDVAQRRLVDAADTIAHLLDAEARTDAPAYELRAPRVGDVGWVIHRQAVLYDREYGWNQEFEALVADIGGRFLREFDPDHERCWIAERRGEIVGAVFVVRKSKRVAQLRMLYVEPSARGLGLGRRLVDECVAFARDRGYRTLTLWTNDVLVSARRIYEAAGFVKTSEQAHRAFGRGVVSQNWELRL